MKYARYYSLFTGSILFFTLCTCSSVRHSVSRDRIRTEERKELELLQSSTSSEISLSNDIKEKMQNIQFHFKRYDLDKPKEEDGSYPVASEGWINKNEKSVQETKVDKEKEQTHESNLNAKAFTNNDVELNSDKKTEAKAGISSLYCFMAGICSILIILILIWCKYGRKKNKTE